MSLLVFGASVGADGGRGPRVLISGQAGLLVQNAIAAAKKRLERPACARLLAEFHASDGLPLAAHLSELSLTPPEYLDTLWFTDADDLNLCRKFGGPIAFTAPGHPVIYVCASHFALSYRRNQLYAETVVIHELLHAAGLGENPPSSGEISRIVTARCTSL